MCHIPVHQQMDTWFQCACFLMISVGWLRHVQRVLLQTDLELSQGLGEYLLQGKHYAAELGKVRLVPVSLC